MLIWTASLLASLGLAGATLEDERPASVADLPELEGLYERWDIAYRDLGVPGFAVAVVRGSETVALDTFGVRNPEGDPVDANTMYYIASCTKTFTAAALAKLAAADELGLDTTVRSHLPRFELADAEVTETLTVRDLLCHRPGINSSPIVFLDAYTGQITEDRYYAWLKDVVPTGQVTYTNVHFTIAGRVIEAVTGKSWKDVIEEQLFLPAGMTRTTAYASRMYTDENCAIPMEWSEDGFVACATRKGDNTMHAAGGTGTTAHDAARWVALQLGGGTIDGVEVMPAQTMREMHTRHTDSPPRGQIRRLTGFGLGWMLGTYRDRPYATHGGGYVGTAAHMSFLPEHGVGVIVLANASPNGQALCDVVSIDVYDRILGVEDRDLLPVYVERVAEERADTAAVPPNDLVAAGALSLAPERYVGEFGNELWGDVTLALQGGELSGRIGDLAMTFESTGADTFAARSGGGQWTGRFVVEGDTVQAVELRRNEQDPAIAFARSEGQ